MDAETSQTSEAPQPPLEATPATAWRKKREEGFLTTLPSGNVARIRRTMDLLTLLKTGSIPNPLRGVLQKSMNKGGAPQKVDLNEFDREALEQFIDLLDNTLASCFIEPKVQPTPEAPQKPEEATEEEVAEWRQKLIEWEQWEPDPGYIATGDIDMEDKMYVFTVAQGMVADVASFRNVTTAGMAPAQNGQGVQDAT